jgi:putative SOS response-associated peptidase YedK
MPVILRREDEEKWLDCATTPFEKAESALQVGGGFGAHWQLSPKIPPQVNSLQKLSRSMMRSQNALSLYRSLIRMRYKQS